MFNISSNLDYINEIYLPETKLISQKKISLIIKS